MMVNKIASDKMEARSTTVGGNSGCVIKADVEGGDVELPDLIVVIAKEVDIFCASSSRRKLSLDLLADPACNRKRSFTMNVSLHRRAINLLSLRWNNQN